MRTELVTKQEQIDFLEGVVDVRTRELEAKQDNIDSLSDIVSAKARDLEVQQGRIDSLELLVSTKDREIDTVQEQYLQSEAAKKAAILRAKQLEDDHRHCEEDMRLLQECAEITKSSADQMVDSGNQKDRIIIEELMTECERLRANNAKLQEDDQRIVEKLKAAYDKHESNHKLLDMRKEEIDKLQSDVKKLEKEKTHLHTRLKYSLQETAKLRKLDSNVQAEVSAPDIKGRQPVPSSKRL